MTFLEAADIVGMIADDPARTAPPDDDRDLDRDEDARDEDAERENDAGPAACDHDWKWIDDWYGDPSIPYGTADCSHWQCTKCDSTDCEDDPPDDGPDPDVLRDRQQDAAFDGSADCATNILDDTP